MSDRLNVAVLEPYYGGSHAAFVDTLAALSRHRLIVATLPARKWKWRMRGAALWFAREDRAWFEQGEAPIDVILANDMLSVADLRALLPGELRGVPVACYFHENQLTYPLLPVHRRDSQYGMTNITSCLAADAVWFNSRSHLADFLAAAEALLRKMPDHVPQGVLEEIRGKSTVLYPPVREPQPSGRDRVSEEPLTILWCHRWEYDKNPEPLFEALISLDAEGVPFRLALLGEQFRTAPSAFARAVERLRHRISFHGFESRRDAYSALLGQCDLVLSTAVQETFGIGVIEAILAGCQPLLPRRLSYPEIIPAQFHALCLYDDEIDLPDRLLGLLSGRDRLSESALHRLHAAVREQFSVDSGIPRLDDAISGLIRPA